LLELIFKQRSCNLLQGYGRVKIRVRRRRRRFAFHNTYANKHIGGPIYTHTHTHVTNTMWKAVRKVFAIQAGCLQIIIWRNKW